MATSSLFFFRLGSMKRPRRRLSGIRAAIISTEASSIAGLGERVASLGRTGADQRAKRAGARAGTPASEDQALVISEICPVKTNRV
jgi:hypothetical protein